MDIQSWSALHKEQRKNEILAQILREQEAELAGQRRIYESLAEVGQRQLAQESEETFRGSHPDIEKERRQLSKQRQKAQILEMERRKEARKKLELQVANGRLRGELDALVGAFEQALDRSLTTADRSTLEAKRDKYGPLYLVDLVTDLSVPELAAWLEKNGVVKND